MAKMLLYFLTICVLMHTVRSFDFYKPPTPTFESFKPKGMRMTIPDEEGIEMVAFFVNLNKELNDNNGEYSKYIVRPSNNLWIYENLVLRLKKNDKIYVKILVLKNDVQYINDRIGPFVVKDLTEKTMIMYTSAKDEITCEASLTNITNTSLDLEEQLIETKEDVAILKKIISREPQTLQIYGSIAQGYTTKENLETMLNNKLQLKNLNLKSAVKYQNYVEITLHDIEDKLRIAKSAKRYLGGQSQQINVIY